MCFDFSSYLSQNILYLSSSYQLKLIISYKKSFSPIFNYHKCHMLQLMVLPVNHLRSHDDYQCLKTSSLQIAIVHLSNSSII